MENAGTDQEFEGLLEHLKRTRGFDFTGYKRSSLTRRIQKRMQILGIARYTDFVDYLEVHPEEFTYLFNTILINVTGFFRDAETWQYLADELIPRILALKKPSDHIRVWCAGVASGEEPFSLAMLLAEALGPEQYRMRVKIYATDVDEEALAKARQATYTEKEVADVPAELLDKYFDRVQDKYVFDRELRRAVIFGRHDLIQDAPISRVDLLVCRNTLMYFNAETQSRVLARFHFALTEGGFLFLGKAELLLIHASTFNPVDLKRRIFAKVPKINLRDRLMMMAQAGNEDAVNHLVGLVRLRDLAFDTGPTAQIVVDVNGLLVLANERARNLFDLTPLQLARPLLELPVSYRPLEIRPLIESAYVDRLPMLKKDVDWVTDRGEARWFDVVISPLQDNGGAVLGTAISYVDVTAQRRVHQQLAHTKQELETAMEELQSSNEELETTNEELQSTIEELETTNEELQSTNEELETMNEELQSTNEELTAINDELRTRTDELNYVNSFLESILASLRGAVVVMDREMQIQVWNREAENMWGLRAEEVQGQNFLGLEIGLPVEQLKRPIRACLIDESIAEEVIVAATTRRGKAFQCQITVSPLRMGDKSRRGVILMMEDRDSFGPGGAR